MPSRSNLLIVDDESSIQKTLRLVFEREGYAVTTAGSCAEALKLFNNGHQWDAVITDLNMEKEDIGLEVARAALLLNSRPVVVICTGFASLSNSHEALRMRVDYLVNKPVDLDELKGALSRHLTLRSQRNGNRANDS